MNEHIEKEEILSVIKEIERDPVATQRTVSHKLGISLGKTNYLVRELVKKGFIKAKNFTSRPNKITKINYLLTEKGLEEKMRLLQHFLRRKETEYNLLREEWELLAKKNEPI